MRSEAAPSKGLSQNRIRMVAFKITAATWKKSNPGCWRAGVSINETDLGSERNQARRER
jgi:hypothetical protein